MPFIEREWDPSLRTKELRMGKRKAAPSRGARKREAGALLCGVGQWAKQDAGVIVTRSVPVSLELECLLMKLETGRWHQGLRAHSASWSMVCGPQYARNQMFQVRSGEGLVIV